MYKGQVVHIVIGSMSYVGTLDQNEHPNGKDWLRINDPCGVSINGARITIAKIAGTLPIYRPFIDIRLPQGVVYRVHVVDKAGVLYEAYQNEIKHKEFQNIVLPGQPGLKAVN